jgi:uncharacterized protein YkwD
MGRKYWFLVAIALACGEGMEEQDPARIPQLLTPVPLTPLEDQEAPVAPVDGRTTLENEVLRLVNARRAAGAVCGSTSMPPVGPVVAEPRLREAARRHSEDMAAQGYFAHESLDGRTPGDRTAAEGYPSAFVGENIAAGYFTPDAVMDGWMASPGHCVNIMRAQFTELGVGYANRADSRFLHYWTQNFGRR